MALALNRPMKPAQFAEYRLMTAILDGTYPPGSELPNERMLAEQIGITRPTLRETLQRLASSGFITIRHGKSTIVNDFWNAGGLGLLAMVTEYGEYLPEGFINHLLEFRNTVLPFIGRKAAELEPEKLREFLRRSPDLPDDPEVFAEYDWDLQILMTRLCGNPVYKMIFNDFAALFKRVVALFFSFDPVRQAARGYHQFLLDAIDSGGEAVEAAIRHSMQMAYELWKQVNRPSGRFHA